MTDSKDEDDTSNSNSNSNNPGKRKRSANENANDDAAVVDKEDEKDEKEVKENDNGNGNDEESEAAASSTESEVRVSEIAPADRVVGGDDMDIDECEAEDNKDGDKIRGSKEMLRVSERSGNNNHNDDNNIINDDQEKGGDENEEGKHESSNKDQDKNDADESVEQKDENDKEEAGAEDEELSDDNSEESKKRNYRSIVDLKEGTITFETCAVHENLICTLCNGLYRDPMTISECLHTFCKTCIIFAFRDLGFVSCPKCNVALGPDPFKAILFDRTVQELVDSLFPDLKEEDEREERVYWDAISKGYSYKDSLLTARGKAMINNGNNDKTEGNGNDSNDGNDDDNSTNDDKTDDRLAISTRSQSRASSKVQLDRAQPKYIPVSCVHVHVLIANKVFLHISSFINALSIYIQPHDEISLGLYPLQSSQEINQLPFLARPLLRTSGRLRIMQLKKYIIKQLAWDSLSYESVS